MDKAPYVIAAPKYNHKSSGLRALYNLSEKLRSKGYDAVTTNSIDGITPNTIVVYPEIVKGNPWNARTVVRYVMNYPGLLGGDKEYDKSEIIFTYSPKFYPGAKVLTTPVIEDFFKDEGLPRSGGCFWVGKGINKRRIPETEGLTEITYKWPATRQELARLFNEKEIFYTYDHDTGMMIEAKRCGCKVVVIEPNNSGYEYEELVTHFDEQLDEFIRVTQEAASKFKPHQPLVSIIIPCWNQAELTKDCVASVKAYTPEDHEIIFIDNGSTDGTKQLLRELCTTNFNYVVIENEQNIGFPRAVNQGIQVSRGKNILVMNNDVIVSPEWMKGLLECLNHAPDVGIVGPRTNSISGRQIFTEGKYQNQYEFIEFARDFRKAYKGHYESWWRIVGFCFLVKREVIEKIGLLDEQFSPGNFEDDDFCIRSVLGGYRNFIANDVFVHHYGSASHVGIDYKKLLDTNKEKFVAKWKKWRDEHNTITCSMIVKNEGKRIGKCLESILPLVDEVVVVDTGSTDNTLDILTAQTDPKVKIYEFAWCDDFSAARNFADSKATKDWIFSLDADEVITEIDREQLWPVTVYGYETRNYCAKCNYKGWRPNNGDYPEYEEGIGWFPSLKIRLYPNDKRLHWSYPVHEVVEPTAYSLGVERRISGVPVHHIGKFNEVWDAEKGRKYYEYLKQAVADEPNDLRHVEELATQAQNLEKYEEAITMWDKYLSFKLDVESEYNAWLNHGHCLACLDRTKEALQSSMRAWKLKEESREAATNCSILLFRLGDYKLADKIAVRLIEEHKDYPIPVAVHGACSEMLKEAVNGN